MDYTIQEIVEYVIEDKQPYRDYEKRIYVYESRAYDALKFQSTRIVLDTVRGYIENDIPPSDINRRIKPSNVFKYLAACKVLYYFSKLNSNKQKDQTALQYKSTWFIRSLCLEKSQGKITLMNLLSNPPLDYIPDNACVTEEDIMILNEIDSNHEVIYKASYGDERDKILKNLYTFCQTKALIISEFCGMIADIVKARLQALLYLSEKLPSKTAIIYMGCSGSGKTKMLKDTYKDDQILLRAIQSTDNFKKDIKAAFTSKYPNLQITDSQAHLLAFSVYKVFCNVLRKSRYGDVSTISEGWYNSGYSMDELCAMRDEYDLKLQIYDFDGDALTIFLRALLRRDEPGAPTPPLNAVARSFKMCREYRSYLINKLKEGDSYRLFYSTKDTTKEISRDSLVSPSNVDELLKDVYSHVIKWDDVQTYGKGLVKYIGMTISMAYK